MKKIILIVVLVSFTLWGMSFMSPGITEAKAKKAAGTVIKGKGLSTLYYIGEDGKRYVFPNSKIYYSWYSDFSGVEEVDMDDLYEYALGGNVRYKPGAILVKIQTDPKVYAVSENGKLRWIKTEALASALYGANWNLLVDDVPDSFFTDYAIDEPIESEDEYDPEEEEDEIPTISHNRGFKARLRIHIAETIQERRCQRLQIFITRVQERLARWGIEVDDLGSDFLEECFNDEDQNQNRNHRRWSWWQDHKIEICHIPDGDPDNAHTIYVSAASARAHLAHGDYLGPCTDENPDEEEDTTAPVISGISAAAATSSVIITWTTDEDADSMVEYSDVELDTASTTEEVGDTADVTSHSIEITGLLPETTYYYIVKSTDEEGNSASSTQHSFTTDAEAVPDETAPEISDVVATTTAETATITWATDEPASSKVSYATESLDTATSTETEVNITLTTSHSIELTGLATSTEYYFIVESADAAANTATSSEDSFTTLAE